MAARIRRALVALLALTLSSCATPVQPQPVTSPPRPPFLAPCPASPNCVSSQAADPEHYVEPLRIVGEPAQAMDELRRIIEAMPRTRIVTASPTALHAEFTSRIFRFVDDVDLQLDAAARLVQVRSASRSGYSDLGVNRRRVEAIRAKFSQSAAPKIA